MTKARRAPGPCRIVGRTIGRLRASPQRAAKAAVAGPGGAGSLVAECLARPGAGHLVPVDPDIIGNASLSRAVGAAPTDAGTRQFKTGTAERLLREARPGIRLEEMRNDIANDAAAMRLRNCDFMFPAVDSMRARPAADASVHQHPIPAARTGAKIRPGAGGPVEEAMRAVRQLRPGAGCLRRNGPIDGTRLAVEAKTVGERKARGCGAREPGPGATALNAAAAGQAANGFPDLRPEGGDAAHQRHHFLRHAARNEVPRKDPNCRERGRRLGMGDAMDLPAAAGWASAAASNAADD